MDNIIKNILDTNNIKYSSITKSNSGFTNLVYFVDDKYVLKISKDDKSKNNLEKEISIYKNISLPYIPRYISSGKYQEDVYLIIEKLQGVPLYSIWHTLSSDKRHNIVKKIADILNTFHSIDSSFLEDKYKINDFHQYILDTFNTNIANLDKLGYDTTKLKDFVSNKLDTIFSRNTYSLIYNDAHFDNFLYDDDRVYLIDFDRVLYSAIDYELLILKSMLDNPSKFANEEDEENIDILDYKEIYPTIRSLCPDMFHIEYVDERVSIYQFLYYIGQAIKAHDITYIQELIDNL